MEERKIKEIEKAPKKVRKRNQSKEKLKMKGMESNIKKIKRNIFSINNKAEKTRNTKWKDIMKYIEHLHQNKKLRRQKKKRKRMQRN